MKMTWEFCGGLLTGLGVAIAIASHCAMHDIHLPYSFVGGVMLIIAGGGITRGAQELGRKDRQEAKVSPDHSSP
jgi:hypothetical protein